MKRQELETLVIDFLFAKAYDPESLVDDMQHDLANLVSWSDYPSMKLNDYWNNDLKIYDFQDDGHFLIDFLNINRELKTFKNWAVVTKPFLNQIDTFIKQLTKKQEFK